MFKKAILDVKFRKFLLAGLLGWAIYLLGAIADNVFAGAMLGEEALAAVEVIAPFFAITAFVGVLVSAGAPVLFSKFVGENDQKRANQVFGLAFVISVLLGVIVGILMFVFKKAFLGIFNLSDGVYEYASQYYNWFIIMGLVYPIYTIVYQIVCADGDTVIPVLGDSMEAAMKIIGSFVLVKYTNLGINGLGIATLASNVVVLLTVCTHFFKKNNSVKFRFKFRWCDIRDMFRISAGSAMTSLCVAILDIVMNWFICFKFGDGYLESYGMINLCIDFTELFSVSVSSVATFLSLNLGAQNNDDIKYINKLGKRSIALIPTVCTVLIGGFCWALPMIYGIKTPEYYRAGWIAALLISSTFVFYGLTYYLGGYYTAFEKPKYAVIAETLIQLVLPIIFCVALSYIDALGFTGLILGFAITPVVGYLIILFIVKKKEGSLYKLLDIEENQFSFDLKLTKENIINVRDQISEKLQELNVADISRIETMGCVEDALFLILDKNGDKKVLDRVTICVGPKVIRILNKDDGETFDLSKYSKEEINSSKNYILKGVTGKKEKYFKTGLMISFNYNVITVRNKAVA